MKRSSKTSNRGIRQPRMLLVLPESFNCAGGIQMFCRALTLAAGRWAGSNDGTLDALVLNDSGLPDTRYVNGGFSSYFGAGKSKSKLLAKYLSLISRAKYDLIIFGHVSLSPLALLAKVVHPGAKYLVMAYGVEVWHPLSPIQRYTVRHADAVLAISDYTKEQLVKNQTARADKIKIFSCTLDPYWQSGVVSQDKQPKLPVILSVTRMDINDRYKGIDSVIRSLPIVVPEVGPVEYKIVGEGNDLPRLRALAAGLGMSRYLSFAGGISEEQLREQYQRCSLFVLPSSKEGFGIVFLEAMAQGKPVLGGAHGGTPSVIKDGETGLLVDNADVSGIARAIIRLLKDEDMRNEFGRAGHERLQGRFTFDQFERNFRKVVEGLQVQG